jgi:hypothetical protein
MPKKNIPKPKHIPWSPKEIAKLNCIDEVLHSVCPDPNRLAEIYFETICQLFPEYAEMHEKALESLPVDSLPLYLHVPKFCLKVIEKRLRNGSDLERKD